MKIGVCDWGIGGLGFYRLLREARPDIDIVYLGDQGVPGYGKFSRPLLTARVRSVLTHFRSLGVEEVVVACNAASTVLDQAKISGVRTTGMIQPTLAHLGTGVGRVGVIGGRRTIVSGAYSSPLRDVGWTVRGRIAQPLSGLIEDGKAASPETAAALDAILRPLREVDRLILACTHYIALEKEIRSRLPKAELVDPATIAWSQLASTLPPPTGNLGTKQFLTTGDPVLMAGTAYAAFAVECDPNPITLLPIE